MTKQVSDQLKRAQRLTVRASFNMNTANSPEEAVDAWAEFLNATDRFYEKLKAVSKGTQYFDWYNEKARIRDEDPMLHYLHRARNADHHGLRVTTEHTATDLGVWPSANGDPLFLPLFRLELLPVSDHRGFILQPPRMHQGQTFVPAFIASSIPTTVRHVATAMISYLASVVAEFEALA